uniref:Uncharacterized protein n=1 Tax=Arundo donax TaxID=35708 RepID=A0A0A9EKB7_ARUDO
MGAAAPTPTRTRTRTPSCWWTLELELDLCLEGERRTMRRKGRLGRGSGWAAI